MTLAIRHLLSMAILPGSAAILVPYLLHRRAAPGPPWDGSVASMALALVGVLLLSAGVLLFAWSLRQFWAFGRGTLAPWDPPRAFVASGPYRLARNPMISGVFMIVVAEACLWRSVPIALWAGTFMTVNAIYIPLSEEPALRRRFGASYEHYVRVVPRFLPVGSIHGRSKVGRVDDHRANPARDDDGLTVQPSSRRRRCAGLRSPSAGR